MSESSKVVLGNIAGVFGVKGWVKVFSYTDPREAITDYSKVWLSSSSQTSKSTQHNAGPDWQLLNVLSGQRHGKTVIMQFANVNDRDAAAALIGKDIAVDRADLAKTTKNEYYWVDLIGCDVINEAGDRLGQVKDMLETGANDVMVLDNQKIGLIPWVLDRVVKQVDVKNKSITVDWDGEYFDAPNLDGNE